MYIAVYKYIVIARRTLQKQSIRNSGVNQVVKTPQKVVPRQRLLHPLRSISTDSPQYFENEDKTEHKCYLNGGMFVNGN